MSLQVSQFTMHITKSTFDTKTNQMRWAMTASDTGEDLYGERMSVELYRNFVKRIEENTPVPEVFLSALDEKSGWNGGMPYTSVSHYRSGVDGANIPGMPEVVYVDGEMLKAKGTFKDTQLGRAVFKSINEDIAGTSKWEDKIRVSIGFLDYKHAHGDFVFTRSTLEDECPMCEKGVGDKLYLDGQLVHLAFTRKPARVTTSVEVEKMADEIKTKEEDALSIVQDESILNEVLTKRSILVERSEEPVVEPVVEKVAACEDESSPEDMKEDEEEKKKKKAPMKSELEAAFDNLVSSIEQSKSLSKEEALKAVQPSFDALGLAVQKSFVDADEQSQAVPTITKSDLDNVVSEIRTLFSGVQETVNALVADVAVLKSTTAPAKIETVVPQPRSSVVSRSLGEQPAAPKLKMSIKEIAERSVGLGG